MHIFFRKLCLHKIGNLRVVDSVSIARSVNHSESKLHTILLQLAVVRLNLNMC